MPLDAVIQLRALRVRQRHCVGFQALPSCISSSAFSEAERFSICRRESLIVYNPSAASLLRLGCPSCHVRTVFF
jgi:hypothetical protein